MQVHRAHVAPSSNKLGEATRSGVALASLGPTSLGVFTWKATVCALRQSSATILAIAILLCSGACHAVRSAWCKMASAKGARVVAAAGSRSASAAQRSQSSRSYENT
eukprot:5859605-Pleurochrysis_carterae.AAC.3